MTAVGVLVLRLMLAWQRHVKARDLRRWEREAWNA